MRGRDRLAIGRFHPSPITSSSKTRYGADGHLAVQRARSAKCNARRMKSTSRGEFTERLPRAGAGSHIESAKIAAYKRNKRSGTVAQGIVNADATSPEADAESAKGAQSHGKHRKYSEHRPRISPAHSIAPAIVPWH